MRDGDFMLYMELPVASTDTVLGYAASSSAGRRDSESRPTARHAAAYGILPHSVHIAYRQL